MFSHIEFQYDRPTRECAYTFAARPRDTHDVMKLRHFIGLLLILIATL
jgi:hypothetical protein